VNAVQILQSLRASKERQAVPKTTCRHIHLSGRPLVVVGYHLAGDPGAPLALLWGCDGDREPNCIVVGEPRDRALRFRVLNVFASEFLDYLSGFMARDEDGACIEAPQVIVPNLATADWLSGIVGRFTRNLRTDGDPPAPASVPAMGKHLSFFADPMPGSSLMVAATEALAAHWQTGQLPSEDLNLAALLGWIDPPTGMDGPLAARVGEISPPAGPGSDPGWDEEVLVGLVREWGTSSEATSRSAIRRELERELREQLAPAWSDCWRSLRLLSTLPEADHAARRWNEDRRAWSVHCDRMAEDRAYFRNIPTPTQSADRLEILERKTDELMREMALDDPLVMAAVIAGGEGLCGSVVETEPERRRANPIGGRTLRRPLIAIEPSLEFSRPAETRLFLASDPRVAVELLPSDPGGPIRAEVIAGANMPATITRLPAVGGDVVLSPFGKSDRYQRSTVEYVPWTHLESSAAAPRRPR
jgi:hypothetical protein